MSATQKTHDNNKSSVFEKIPPDVRRRLDLAIIHRTPPTFQSVWMQFELAQYGGSFSALYRYARRLRDRVNLAEAVFLADDGEADVDAAIQKLLSRRLLELLLHTNTADFTREIAALTSAQRKGARTSLDLQRLALDRDHLRLKSEALEVIRQRNLRLLKETGDRSSAIPHSEIRIPTSANPVNPVHSQGAQPLRLACSNDHADGAPATAPASAQPAAP